MIFLENNNLNDDMMNKIKNLVDNGNISDAMSQISPEMIQNFSKILSNNNSAENTYSANNDDKSNSNTTNSTNTSNNTNNSSNNFDFNNIDMNTILKMKSVMEKMNNKNDPRSNLLYSLKPYLRDTRQEKLDQYVNLLNMTKIAEALKTDKKENNNNG